MKNISSKNLNEFLNKEVKIAGFANSVRELGKLSFVDLRDVYGQIQCIFNESISITEESVLEINGIVKKRPEKLINSNYLNGDLELEVISYKILSRAEALPIKVNTKGENEAEIEKRLDYRWIDLRKPTNSLIFKIWTELEHAMREYWNKNNYIEIHSPKLLGAASESGSEVFEVKYFDKKAYLAQSPQFYKQMAMAAGFEKVFEVGPVFRAENSNTFRHTTEFTGYDMEISYIDSHEDIMAEEEKLISHAIKSVSEKFGIEVHNIFSINIEVPKVPFPRLTMKEAKEILAQLNVRSEKPGDLSSEEEKELGKFVKKEFKHDFVFITEYPHEFRAFYHMRNENDNSLTKSFDLLYKGLEITTGAQREHRYEVLMSQAKERSMNLEQLDFYFEFFKYGCPQHGGLGMGPSRLLMKLLDLENLRDAMFLFRNPRRLNP